MEECRGGSSSSLTSLVNQVMDTSTSQDDEIELAEGSHSLSELHDDQFQIYQRRGRSTVQKCLGHSTGSTLPAAGRSTVQDGYLAPEEFGRFTRLYDNQFHIRPWGFVDKEVESRFIEYHWLTFTTNYRGIVAKLWGAVFIVHGFGAVYNSYGEEVLPVALSLLRCAVGAGMAAIFSNHNMVLIRKAQQLVTLVYCQAIIPILSTLEYINPATSETKVTVFVLVAVCCGFLIDACSWLSECWVFAMGFVLPAIIILSTTWEETDHDRMMERAEKLLMAGIAGPVVAALWSVDYRRRWALASQQERRTKEVASGKLRRSRRSSARSESESPLPRLAEDRTGGCEDGDRVM